MTTADKLAAEVGMYFFENESNIADIYERCRKVRMTVSELGITNIEFADGQLQITLRRPGLIIGRKGIVIDTLTKFLADRNPEFKTIKIVEYSGPLDWLYNFEYAVGEF